MIGLASSAFARHYSRNHMLFSLPVGTEMFHFPTFPLPALYIQAGVTRSQNAWRGFPIRKSSAHSSIISSPRLIADFYVLLRLQMPRHPPFALRNLTTKIKIAIDSSTTPTRKVSMLASDLRCSRPLCSSQHTIGTTLPQQNPPASCGPSKDPHRSSRPVRPNPGNPKVTSSLVPQDPTTCTSRTLHPDPSQPHPKARRTESRKHQLPTALSMFHP